MTSWPEPTPDQVRQAIVSLVRPDIAAHFFDKLDNPYWVRLLAKQGFFKHPPEATRQGNSISFPVWPHGRYLVRAANADQAAAVDAAEAVLGAESTDNHLVHMNYVEVALAAPVAAAARIANSEEKWLKQQVWLFSLLPERYSDLAAHLAAHGAVKQSMKLNRALFTLSPHEIRPGRSEPKARFDAWHFRDALKRSVNALAAASPQSATVFLCDLLYDVSKIHRSGSESQREHSIAWRPAIEQSDQNWDFGEIPDVVVDSTRNTLEELIRTERIGFQEVSAELLKRAETHTIFRRLLLHLARVFRERVPAVARELALDVSQMHSLDLRHEYLLLVRDVFPSLAGEDQKVILDAISNGPDVSRWDASSPDSRADRDRFVRIWKRDKLSMIKEHLDSDWRQIYDGLVETLGEAKHPEFLSHRSGVFVGPVSPKTADELSKMSDAALLEYLVVWRSGQPYMAPSEEGLSRALQEMMATHPERLLHEKVRIRRLHPAYVRPIISGLAQAVKAGRAVDEAEACDLAIWATQQTGIPYELSGDFIDKDWTGARSAALDMITSMMASKTGVVVSKPVLSFSLRKSAWEILAVCAEDPDPRPDRERPEAGEIEPGMIALNSVRGAAIEGVIDYAFWVRGHFEKEPDSARLLAAGLDEMPEVREVLEKHLDTDQDPSLGVRSVYGRWFPWLVTLDRKWAAMAADRIFPLDPAEALLFDAAWFTYISFSGVFNDAARLLRRQYEIANERLNRQTRVRVRSLRAPAVALGEHLLTLYGRGEIPLQDVALKAFFEKANAETRQGALVFVGRSLMPSKENVKTHEQKIPREILERFRILWETRSASSAFAEEASAFGWWFGSGQFEDAWAIEQLVRAAKASVSVDGLMFCADRLVRLATVMPSRVAEFLEVLVSTDDPRQWVAELDDSLRRSLQAILAAAGPAAAIATTIINQLAEKQIADYGDLLPK